MQYQHNCGLQSSPMKIPRLRVLDACVKLQRYNPDSKVKSSNKDDAPMKQCPKPKDLIVQNRELAVFLETCDFIESLVGTQKDKKTDAHSATSNCGETMRTDTHHVCVDETVLGSDFSMCLPEELNIPEKLDILKPFLYYTDLKTVSVQGDMLEDNKTSKSSGLDKSTFNWSEKANPLTAENILPLGSSSSTVELELTPPSSAVSGSVVSSSVSDSEDNLSQDITLDELCVNEKMFIAESLPHNPKNTRKSLQVSISPFEPTLHQLQDVYRKKRKSTLNRYQTHTGFRESRLRPNKSLRQFIPFMFNTSQSTQPSDKKFKRKHASSSNASHVTHKNNKDHSAKKQIIKKRKLLYQTQLLASAKKEQLKLELKQKKEAFKLRNKYENALESINQRLIRQNWFWKMLPH